MATKQQERRPENQNMLFSAWNYKVLALGLLLVIIGFTGMYLENEVHGFISLYVSPIVIMAGYITVIFAIMKHGKQQNGTSETTPG